jgi:hypothetical protein
MTALGGDSSSGVRPRLVALELHAELEGWRAAGFTVGADGRCVIGTTAIVLTGGAGGFGGWTLAGGLPDGAGLDGVATTIVPAGAAPTPAVAAAAEPHANGVTAIDHVVLATPDTARTFAILEAAGFVLRRVRDAGGAERPLRQGFFLFADTLLEVVGPPEPEPGTATAPAALWGITLVADLEVAAAAFGGHLSAPRPAVQAGREIAVVAREAGLGVRVALMTPRV